MQQYDIASKVLIDRCRDDIIRYLLDSTWNSFIAARKADR